MKTTKKINVLFNASVIIASALSKSGGSGLLISFVKQKKIIGLISEIILDEVIRNLQKLYFSNLQIKKTVSHFIVLPAPHEQLITKYLLQTIDDGDAHVLASAKEGKVDYLVSLDKKHILILKSKIKEFSILNPKELIQEIENRRL
ncbi:putative toxin-antitoxin system toxin component, PIN family [Candidatus Roizmanbacteria bacterium RIFCSPHIGHO2_02_FULL_37_13b]|uniref:Putative toxin-antitoxin system toxin component, PIN family n=1 Tax=Candidatus Roizmanbacteria bacterium RIFCSPLOWO2_02_FULL_36_11 TaxID=1802071 RepID=A0A1F7JHH5_9BACT|nr:MAG: putative toxin-antitoxin system toxin component, PIN family [Candidatus Roizmanbacteria bacterium RIFCSPHIGHO2_02_FULL_37_13b]OGK55045.1 MAG: putative toxin-antitoxin system toxin component, PIN family [Candidatus Roizmanbacteria bacterium RIFCSPLOWO2_02_FULL_36_11]